MRWCATASYGLTNVYLSAQDENLVKIGVNIQLVIKKSSAEPLNAYCLILEEASYIIKVINGQMTRIE